MSPELRTFDERNVPPELWNDFRAKRFFRERNVPPELWNDPRAKRFFRFVREEVELQEARVRVLEHYEEVIVLDDEATGESRMLAASFPEPLIDRCYVGGTKGTFYFFSGSRGRPRG